MGMMSKSRIVVACSILLLVSAVCFNISSVSARSRWKVRWTATVSDAATYYYMEYGCTQLLSVEYRDSGFLEGYAEFGVTVGGYLKLIDFWITGQYESYLRKQYCRWPRSGVGTYVSQHVWYITDENVEQTRQSFLSSLDVSGPHTQYYGPNAGKRYVVFHFPHHFVHSHMIAHYEDYGPDYDSVSDYEYDDATFYHMDLHHSWTRYWYVYYNEGTQTFLMDEYVEANYPYFQEHEVYAHWQIEVDPLLGSPPKIEEIIVTGIPYETQNPVTDTPYAFPSVWGDLPPPPIKEKVRLEAKITSSPDFEVTSVWWYGDVKLGEGNPYEYVAAPGTHGKKTVMCTISYRNLFTGETGEDTKTKEFNLFFVKWGDDDKNGKPNWFDYWNQLDVGDRHGMKDVRFDALMRGPNGRYFPGTTYVLIGPGASGTDEKPPGTKIIGIDNFAQTLTHECLHYHHWDIWWNGRNPVDTDGDWLPDWFEDVGDDGLANTTDAHELDGVFNGAEIYDVTHARTLGNPWPDDEEWETHSRTDSNRGPHLQDWANPGKQTDPPEPDPPFPEEKGDKWLPLPSPPAKLTGTYSDYGTDTDADALYNYLSVEVGVDVTIAGIYLITGGLEDSKGNMVWASNIANLNVGTQSMTLNFDGLTLRENRANDPYNVVLLNLYDENDVLIDYAEEPHTTSAYSYAEFQVHPEGALSDEFSDYGTDPDNDGLYNYLTIDVGVDVTAAGNYVLEGWLYDSSGNAITRASSSAYLNVGSQSMTLNFDGLSIRRHRVDGLYDLRYLSLSGSDQVDFIYDAYETSAYSYTDFQKTDAAFTGSYSDYGKDTDGDGQYNYLTVEVEIDVSTSGKYAIIGWLYDDTEAEMVMATSHAYLDAGSQTIPLDFDGASIYDHGVDGPYDLKYLALYDEDGALMDTLNYACTTATYDYAQFGGVTITREVEISISPAAATPEPGASVTYTISVHNTGSVEDTYDLTVQGLNAAWYSIAQTSVTLDADQTEPVALMVTPPHSPLALKEHIFTVTATSQGDPSVSDSTEAAVSADFSPVLPEMPTGGLAVAVTPKLTVTSAGTEITLSVTMVNNENFDDTFWLNLTSNGVPTSYQANLAWFNWTSVKVFVPAGSSITLQLTATIPPEASSGYKIFKAEATSTAWTNGNARDSGIIRLT